MLSNGVDSSDKSNNLNRYGYFQDRDDRLGELPNSESLIKNSIRESSSLTSGLVLDRVIRKSWFEEVKNVEMMLRTQPKINPKILTSTTTTRKPLRAMNKALSSL
jgi:hypothetical protein